MAALPVEKLSHKNYRKLLKKLRRKSIRKKRALERDALSVTGSEVDLEDPETPISTSNKFFTCQSKDSPPGWIEDAVERQVQHELWLQREVAARKEFVWKQALKEKLDVERAEQERKIRAEWEETQRKNKEIEDEKTAADQKKKKREAALLNDITSKLEEAPTHNPEAPVNFGTERDRQNCPFFLKTGACRFGDRCSRFHMHPNVSCTILIPGMYHHFGISESFCDEYDTDISLEYEEGETYTHFREFYDDVVPEFKKIGEIIQFKTCCNHEPHLRGNVYIQYKREDAALKAYQLFNGRWYAGKQLSCSFTTITKWKSAICGLFSQKRCPKGKNCNFLHVFRNPRNEFCEADRDYQPSPWQNRFGSYRSRSPQSTRSSRSNYSHRYSNQYSRDHVKRSRSHRSRTRSRSRSRSHSRSRSPSKSRSERRNIDSSSKSSRKRPSAVSPHNRSSRSRSKSRSKSASPTAWVEIPHHKKSSKKRHSKKSKKHSHKKKSKNRRSSSSGSSFESGD